MRALLPLVVLLSACASSPAPATADVAWAEGRLAARLVQAAYDRAAPAATCKVYHQVFAPDGRLLTKDLGGKFEHHRGLFVGWNSMRRGAETFDFWHCRRGEHQQFVGFVPAAKLGFSPSTQVAAIDWRTADNLVLQELRALRSWVLPDGAVALALTIVLTSPDQPVTLDGDPQHAGQQFRALQAFAEPGAEPVRYVLPATATTQPNDIHGDCAWIAAVLPLPGGPVTVLRTEGEANPKPATWSTRAYGRFGAMCTTTLQPGRPLRLDYRYAIALGEQDALWCARTATALATAN